MHDVQILSVFGLFADTFWVEANEVGLSCRRLRPNSLRIPVFSSLGGRLGSDDLMFGRFSRSDFLFRSDVQGADLMEHRSDVFSPI